ncbi:DUF6083 domain-containing protein [Streptomyces vietnamensis]|uniref:DUF6083 domain-containing protein n=1 Tax=Streptomyces vietnamensis TaxID=362257 RepID=UPI000AA81AD6|nr:DUF6083 domain-containing protein [Streptomyces vietnamensis]
MALCAECERAGAAHPVREPVLVGDVLAGLADLMAQPMARALGAVPDATCAVGAVPDGTRAVNAVPDGTRAVSAVPDGTRAVSAVPDATCAVSAGSDAARAVSAVPQQRVPAPAARGTAAPAAPGKPSPAVCDRCGARAEWHRTVRGRWVMIEPGELTARLVPAGRRWRVAGDGTTVNLGSAVPSDTCRVSHFDVCPARPAPADSPLLLALWRSHARRTA